ncbi:MAG: hypothetical protein KDA85_04855 [Planctomycetaceae bacterium]|nr:hypothetical protein [Planctomycetaceae bacterium]
MKKLGLSLAVCMMMFVQVGCGDTAGTDGGGETTTPEATSPDHVADPGAGAGGHEAEGGAAEGAEGAEAPAAPEGGSEEAPAAE